MGSGVSASRPAPGRVQGLGIYLSPIVTLAIVLAVHQPSRGLTPWEEDSTLVNRTFYPLPAAQVAHIDSFFPEFGNSFVIEMYWNPAAYGSPAEWPWPPDSIYAFVDAIMPHATGGFDEFEESIASRVMFYFGDDRAPQDYDDLDVWVYVEYSTYVDSTHYDNDFKIRFAPPGYSHYWYSNYVDLSVAEAPNQNTVFRMATDAFAHEWQHLAYQTRNPRDLHTFAGSSAATEYLSQCGEYKSGQADWLQPTDSTASTDLPYTRGIGKQDYYVKCLGHGQSRLHQTWSLFAPYLADHYYDLEETFWYQEPLYNWVGTREDYNNHQRSRQDFWALAEELEGEDYSSYFNTTSGSDRVSEMLRDYALAVWVNDPGVAGFNSVWQEEKWPRYSHGLDSDFDQWCYDDARSRILYHTVTASLDSIIDRVYPDDVLDTGPCAADSSLPRELVISSFAYNVLPFVAGPSVSDPGRCYSLRVQLTLDDEYICDDPEDPEPVTLSTDDVFHFQILGYPEATDSLDLHGDEAELLLTYEKSGLDTQVLPYTFDFAVPLFGSHYQSVVLLLTLTKSSYPEGQTTAAIIPYDYWYWAERGKHGLVTSNETWPDFAGITTCDECVLIDGLVEVRNGGSVTIEPGAKVYVADAEAVGVDYISLKVNESGSALSIGDATAPIDSVVIEPVGDYGYSWAGLFAAGNCEMSVEGTRLEGLEYLHAVSSPYGGAEVNIEDVRVDFAPGELSVYAIGMDTLAVHNAKFYDVVDFRLYAHACLDSVRIAAAEAYEGPALKLYDDISLDDVLIVNAKDGIAIYDYAEVQLGDDEGGCSVQVEGRGRYTAGSEGLILSGHCAVDASHCLIRDFEKGILAQDYANLTLRDSEVQDCIDGVYVPPSRAALNLGTDQDAGDDCISSELPDGGVRVYNRSRSPVQAARSYWYTSNPVDSLFDGVVYWANYQTSCNGAGTELNLYLGQPGGQGLPAKPALANAFPNPFNPTCVIRCTLPADGSAFELAIYDVGGRKVASLDKGIARGASLDLVWDGRDSQGHAVSSGIYFARLVAGDFDQSSKLVLLR